MNRKKTGSEEEEETTPEGAPPKSKTLWFMEMIRKKDEAIEEAHEQALDAVKEANSKALDAVKEANKEAVSQMIEITRDRSKEGGDIRKWFFRILIFIIVVGGAIATGAAALRYGGLDLVLGGTLTSKPSETPTE